MRARIFRRWRRHFRQPAGLRLQGDARSFDSPGRSRAAAGCGSAKDPAGRQIRERCKKVVNGEEVFEIRGKQPNGKVREVEVNQAGNVIEIE